MECTRLLVVDDDPNIRELLTVNLLAAGYQVECAVNGDEAIRKIRQQRPALIVLDIMMPEVDGWELCKLVRDDPDLEKIKIIMLTAKGTEKDKMIGREIFRADEYMTKPFDIDELLLTIRNMICIP